ARKEQIIDDFNDTSTSIRSISSIQMLIEIHYNDNFLSYLVSSNIIIL
ncbi:unnamed protein product, partial [Rotaria magnacalcarata]